MKAALQTNFFLLFIALITTACGSARPASDAASGTEARAVPRAERRASGLWTRQIGAHISHVSATPDGRFLLVSTSGERKPDAGLRLFNASGKRLWFHGLPQPVRAQAMAADGSIVVTSGYDGKLRAFGKTGRQLWEHEYLGRPAVFSKSRAIVLFNDDDAEPKTAFVSYDFKGRRLGSVAFAADSDEEPLDMFAADDESFVLVSTTSNGLGSYRVDGTRLWQVSLPGNSIAAAGTTLPRARAYVLTSDGSDKRSQLLSALDSASGKKLWTRSIGPGFELLQIVRQGSAERVVLYGNTREGQLVAGFETDDGKPLWRYSYPNNASYSSLLLSSGSYVTVALDEGRPAGQLRLVSIDGNGKAIRDAAVEASHGLFSFASAPKRGALFVGAGDPGHGSVSFFGVKH